MMEFVSWDGDIPNIWKIIKFHGSKPPTSFNLNQFIASLGGSVLFQFFELFFPHFLAVHIPFLAVDTMFNDFIDDFMNGLLVRFTQGIFGNDPSLH